MEAGRRTVNKLKELMAFWPIIVVVAAGLYGIVVFQQTQISHASRLDALESADSSTARLVNEIKLDVRQIKTILRLAFPHIPD
jgi:hypothetical protein